MRLFSDAVGTFGRLMQTFLSGIVLSAINGATSVKDPYPTR